MSTKYLGVLTLGALAIVFASAGSADAGWGRYRVTTHYGTPSAPVIRETVVVHGAFRPLVVAPAPIVVSPAPITAYYAAPAVYVPAPRAAARAVYYAPAPRTFYYAPAPATYYHRGYPMNAVILP
jgi:hypothetical protein